ncbi:unnamed protein product [Sphagnum jensenii]
MASLIFAPSSPVASLYGARQAPGATALIRMACGYSPLRRSLGREEEKHLSATTCVVSHFRWVFFFFASLRGTTRSMASNLEKVKFERNGDSKIEFDVYVVGKKVGVTGFCMGGGLSIASAVRVPGIDAVVAFYGTPPPHLADPTAKALEEKLKKANVPLEVYLYPNVGHAFMNSSSEAIERKKATGFREHHQEAVDLAWSRFDLWFKKYLQVGK